MPSGSSRQASTPPVRDQAADLGGGVFGLGLELAAEVGLGVEAEDREAEAVLEADDERLVVGDELGRRG